MAKGNMGQSLRAQYEERIRIMDERYRQRIENQKGSINRLLKDGSYTVEMEFLHTRLAEVMADNERLRQAVDSAREGVAGRVATPPTGDGFPSGLPTG